VAITKDTMAIRLSYDTTLPIYGVLAVVITEDTMAMRLPNDATLPI